MISVCVRACVCVCHLFSLDKCRFYIGWSILLFVNLYDVKNLSRKINEGKN